MPSSAWSRIRAAGRTLARGLAHLIYPNTCWICGDLLAEGQHGFCDFCRGALTSDAHPACPRCASSVGPYIHLEKGCPRCRDISFAFQGAVRLGPYDGLLRETVIKLKRWDGEGLAEMVGKLWAEHAGQRLRALGADVVVPVPLHWWRHLRRGYNQSQTLARAIAEYLQVPCRPRWLRRIRRTPRQTYLTGPERRSNVRGAFRARRGLNLAGKTVLIVDDVLTTGSTAHEAARALRIARPARIMVAVLAHGQ